MEEIQKSVTVGQLVKTSNQFARGRKVKVESLDASRTLAALIACINKGDAPSTLYKVGATEIMRDEGGKSYASIKKLCASLAGAFVECERMGARGPIYTCIPLFARLEYESGIISCEFNEKASPHLFELSSMFTTYRLGEFLSLSSKYAMTLFELLRSWSSEQEIIMPLEKLHRLVDAPISTKINFAEFTRRVLDVAEREIHEKTSLRFFWTPIRTGKKVTAIRFEFSEEAHKKPARLSSRILNSIPRIEEKTALDSPVDGLFGVALACYQEHNGQCFMTVNSSEVCDLCKSLLQKRPERFLKPKNA